MNELGVRWERRVARGDTSRYWAGPLASVTVVE
jgi:hypothetical protein